MAGIVGVVLAGGRSTRFGSEKAMAVVEGAPMIARVATVLGAGGAPVAVNAPETSGAAAWARAEGLPLLPDAAGAPDGPLSGVLAGLDWAAARGAAALVTAPCDTPRLPPDLVPRLAQARGEAPAAAAVTADGSHPLCALWSVQLREPLRLQLAEVHPSVSRWLEQVGAAWARFAESEAFANLNHAPQVTSGPARRI